MGCSCYCNYCVKPLREYTTQIIMQGMGDEGSVLITLLAVELLLNKIEGRAVGSRDKNRARLVWVGCFCYSDNTLREGIIVRHKFLHGKLEALCGAAYQSRCVQFFYNDDTALTVPLTHTVLLSRNCCTAATCSSSCASEPACATFMQYYHFTATHQSYQTSTMWLCWGFEFRVWILEVLLPTLQGPGSLGLWHVALLLVAQSIPIAPGQKQVQTKMAQTAKLSSGIFRNLPFLQRQHYTACNMHTSCQLNHDIIGIEKTTLKARSIQIAGGVSYEICQ